MTLSITMLNAHVECCYAQLNFMLCVTINSAMLGVRVIILSAIMLSIIMLSVIMLSITMEQPILDTNAGKQLS